MKKEKHPLKIFIWLFCVALFAAIGIFAVMKLKHDDRKNNQLRTVVEATCTEAGYIVTENLSSGTTEVENLPALGHLFGDWHEDEALLTKSRTCERCGFRESVRISSAADETMPNLYLNGSMDGIGKKTKVVLDAEFSGIDQHFNCFAIMTLQGHSTYGYPKRNFTVRFYEDDQSINKHKVRFKNWNAEHKYILKANYVDISQCRNLIGARIWSSMAACRDNLSPRLAALPCYGAVDGFPVNVYLNEKFIGLYMMNLHKDDDLYQMKEGEQAALVICNQQTTDEALFRAEAAFLPDYSSDWEVEFCGTKDEAWAKNSFNQLISFVMNSSEEEFRNDIDEYLDVDAAIDYLIFIYSLGLQDSGAKDLVMLNYGDIWIPSAYDMDEAFGLDADAAAYLSPEDFVPVKTGVSWNSGTGSLLWDRMLDVFEEEVRIRYNELRKDVLSEETLIGMVNEFIDEIPVSSYDMDMNLFSDRPVMDTDMRKQITDYIYARFEILDLIMEADIK